MFLVGPIVIIFVVSFWDYTEFSLIPDLYLDQLHRIVRLPVTYSIYLNTLKYAALSWVFTLTIGFTVAYFLAFHVRSLKWQIALFLLCTIPFWTSNIIRMIAWIPVLGRHGLINEGLTHLAIDRFTAGMAALFRLRGRPGLRAPLHALHGRADFQLDDADR